MLYLEEASVAQVEEQRFRNRLLLCAAKIRHEIGDLRPVEQRIQRLRRGFLKQMIQADGQKMKNGNNTKNRDPANPKKPNRGFPTITPPSPTHNIDLLPKLPS